MHGTVKWFNSPRGYGFITDTKGNDVFVHYTGIAGKGFKVLEEGQQVRFDLGDNGKGPIAINVIVIPEKGGLSSE